MSSKEKTALQLRKVLRPHKPPDSFTKAECRAAVKKVWDEMDKNVQDLDHINAQFANIKAVGSNKRSES